ncbi:MAG: PAS-domain containing protein [Thalassovita sp.]|nr:PAS-domain containing protein [Thalassovita sp.]
MLDFQSLLLVCAISLIVAAITYQFITRTAPARSNAASGPDVSTRFLYDGSNLIDTSDGGGALLELGDDDPGDWQKLARKLAPRFPDFPAAPPSELNGKPITLDSIDLGPRSQAQIENIEGLIRVSLIEHLGDKAPTAADLHQHRVWARRVDTLRSAVHGAPYPIWQTDGNGGICWSNSAYDLLARACIDPALKINPVLFDLPDRKPPVPSRNRVSVTLKTGSEQLWYDVTSVQSGRFTMHYATDVNAVVKAQDAQKNFVQTLTKTFAQLSIGLAIFNRKRELALFNPALIDLTRLSAEFLGNRPSLHSFFDHLRDNRTMPEPKDYSSWRDRLDDLVNAAADGRYTETWNLPDGLTYRVSGRPHPDGAVAFLFEDVSAEVSLTRRFRTDLELNQSALDHLSLAVAVFSSGGRLSFCNHMYRDIWKTDPDSGFIDVTIQDSLRLWQQASLPSPRWQEIARFVTSGTPGSDKGGTVQLRDGTRLNTRVARIRNGASMVIFDYARPARLQHAMTESA